MNAVRSTLLFCLLNATLWEPNVMGFCTQEQSTSFICKMSKEEEKFHHDKTTVNSKYINFNQKKKKFKWIAKNEAVLEILDPLFIKNLSKELDLNGFLFFGQKSKSSAQFVNMKKILKERPSQVIFLDDLVSPQGSNCSLINNDETIGVMILPGIQETNILKRFQRSFSRFVSFYSFRILFYQD